MGNIYIYIQTFWWGKSSARVGVSSWWKHWKHTSATEGNVTLARQWHQLSSCCGPWSSEALAASSGFLSCQVGQCETCHRSAVGLPGWPRRFCSSHPPVSSWRCVSGGWKSATAAMTSQWGDSHSTFFSAFLRQSPPVSTTGMLVLLHCTLMHYWTQQLWPRNAWHGHVHVLVMQHGNFSETRNGCE